MSGFSALQDGAASTQPKQMTSRLLNMKFMQRATATSVRKNPFNPSTPNERPLKRRRTEDFSTTIANLNSPSTTPNTPTHSERTPTSATQGREAIGLFNRSISNNFNTAGEETEWVLDVRLPTMNGNHDSKVHDEESESDEEDDIWASHNSHGRQTYGSFNKKKQRKSTNTNTDSGATVPTPSTSKTNKRTRLDDDDEDLSPLPSNSDFDESSEGEIQEENPRAKGKFNFKSQADLKRMDAFDFQSPDNANGLGRQRHGLVGTGGFASPGHGHGHGRGGKPKKKPRKTL